MGASSPYPFERWPRIAKADARRMRLVTRGLPLDRATAALERLGELIGCSIALSPSLPEACPPEAMDGWLTEPLVGVVLRLPQTRTQAVLELEPGLALELIDRTLGGHGVDTASPAPGPLEDVERGVLGYALARALAELGCHVATVVTTAAAVRTVLGGGAVVWPTTVRVGERVGAAWLWLADSALGMLPAQPRRTGALALDHLELAVVGAIGTATLEPAEVASLRPFDVVLLDRAWVEPAGEGWQGLVRLRVAGASRTSWWCRLDGDDKLRLERIEQTHEPSESEGRRMGQDDNTQRQALVRAGDAPIELTVEIARFTMPLEELAALRAGEILTTGRAVGERVTVRAAGRAVAAGDLVDVDGEVGVRLTQVGDEGDR